MSSKRFIFHSKTISKVLVLIFSQVLGKYPGDLSCQNCGLFPGERFDDDQRHCQAYDRVYCANEKNSNFGVSIPFDHSREKRPRSCGSRMLTFSPFANSEPGWAAVLVTKGIYGVAIQVKNDF